MRIDINCDLGEGVGNDEAVMPFITSANIACGFHAGNPHLIMKTIQFAIQHEVVIGAHPGYPDLEGFGRRNMPMGKDELYASVLYQLGALKGMTEALGGKLQYVKPHGALYNIAAVDIKIALTIARAIKDVDDRLMLVGLANSEMIRAAREVGIRPVSEVFADRAYTDEGTLVSRSQTGAVIHDLEEITRRAIRMVKNQEVVSITGKLISLHGETICIHGDHENAAELAAMLHKAFQKEGILTKSFVS